MLRRTHAWSSRRSGRRGAPAAAEKCVVSASLGSSARAAPARRVISSKAGRKTSSTDLPAGGAATDVMVRAGGGGGAPAILMRGRIRMTGAPAAVATASERVMAATEHTPDEGAQRIAEGTARYGGQWIDRFGARALHVVRAVCAGEAQPADALHVRVYCSADRAFADWPVADVVARLAAAGPRRCVRAPPAAFDATVTRCTPLRLQFGSDTDTF